MASQSSSAYLHFDVGSDADAHHELRGLLLSLGGTSNDTSVAGNGNTRYMLSIPIRLQSEVETYLAGALELLDHMDVEPCRVELRYVTAHMAADESLTLRKRPDGMSSGVNAGYVGSDPRIIEICHTLTVPKRGSAPPVSVSDLPGGSAAWSVSDAASSVWEFRWRRTSNASGDVAATFRRDREKMASSFKGIQGITVSSTIEQVAACWSYPFEPTKDKLHRFSFPRFIGTSDRWTPDFFALCAEIKRNHDQRFLSDDEVRARAIATLRPFRRIALRHGVTPVVMAFGMTPMIPGERGLQFVNHFCSRGVAYAPTASEAETLIDGLDELLCALMHSGRSSILDSLKSDRGMVLWAEAFAANGTVRPKVSTEKKTFVERNVMATTENVLTMTGARPFKPLNQIAREVLAQKFGKGFDIRDLGVFAIAFRTEAAPDGSRIGGCLFALVQGRNLDLAKLRELAAGEFILLHRAPFRLSAEEKSTPSTPKPATLFTGSDKDAPARQAKRIFEFRQAMNLVRRLPRGTRLKQIAAQDPAAYAWHMADERLRVFDERIEGKSNVGRIMLEMWTATTDYSESSFWTFLKLAGVPSLGPQGKPANKNAKKKSKAAKA